MVATKLFFCLALVAVSLKDVRALTKEEAQHVYEEILPHITECSKEHSLAEGALKEAKESKSTEGIEPCFFSCVLKKTGVMGDDGKLDTAKALEKSKEIIKSDEELEKIEKVINECSSVNDGDLEECPRGKAIFECFAKHKIEFLPL